MRIAVSAALVLAATALSSPAPAVQVPGGGPARTDCHATFDVRAASAVSTRKVECLDGDPACDQDGACNDSCRFAVALCVNQPGLGNCTPQAALKRIRQPKRGPFAALAQPPLDGSRCGPFLDVDVPLKLRKGGRVKRPGKRATNLTAVGTAKPKLDPDRLVLRCLPNPTCNPSATCAPNAAGGPDELRITVLGQGNDLDTGWTGISHGFPVPSDSRLSVCLANCDGTTDPLCDSTGATGPGTVNGETFGPPLPLVAGGVPVCVVNRFASGTLTGTANVATGEVGGNVNLLADVFVSDATRVCPRCENGTCDSGLRRGEACSVDGEVTVVNSLAANKRFRLSKQCIPGGNPVSTLNITLPLTTGSLGTPGTGGSKPCREREAQGVPVKDSDCAGACVCGPGACQVGTDVCTELVPNPANPAETICADIKGGLTQCCCSNNPALSCFPTEAGNVGIQRTGRPLVPQPDVATDSSTYPKVAEGTAMVSTFCVAATGNANIDTVSGLPGPGALLLSTRAEFLKQP